MHAIYLLYNICIYYIGNVDGMMSSTHSTLEQISLRSFDAIKKTYADEIPWQWHHLTNLLVIELEEIYNKPVLLVFIDRTEMNVSQSYIHFRHNEDISRNYLGSNLSCAHSFGISSSPELLLRCGNHLIWLLSRRNQSLLQCTCQ